MSDSLGVDLSAEDRSGQALAFGKKASGTALGARFRARLALARLGSNDPPL
jgi:hypothetical protein